MTLPSSIDPEYRQDAITGRWVIISSERARRPVESPGKPLHTSPDQCPFCEGRESETPPELYADRDGTPSNGKGWRIRVVPNAFPAVRAVSSPSQSILGGGGLGAGCVGVGRHEVVVECPEHAWTATARDDAHFGRLFVAYRERLRALREDPDLRYALVFKNAGAGAGASQEHAHSQILATRFVLPLIAEELAGCERKCPQAGGDLLGELLAWELGERRRIVAQTERFVAWCPWASRFPFELWLAPRDAGARFEESPTELLLELGALVRKLIRKLESYGSAPAYNYYLHTAPIDAGDYSYYRWHLELAPRWVGLAGFEIGGGMFINPAPPEFAADRWRE